MHDSQQLSVYTPSNTDPEILEKIFVQRHHLLEKMVGWCEESIITNKKNHLLFVGPRGSGKTHFISMLVNRLKSKAALQDKMIILWLGEDDVITSLIDLFLLMIESLTKTEPRRFNKDCLLQAKGQKPDAVAEIIMHSISEQIGENTILLVKENMSDVFAGLKDIGQKKLRAFLQEKNNIAILGTSQQLCPAVSSRDSAFFGFFDAYHLKTLSVDDANRLISNIAALNNSQPLVDFLKTAQGCYRVRALHHLAGGNHRLYVELATFLTVESLNDFVSALSKLADNLTPYFQERIRSLPAQQGRIVQKLCDLQGATPVKSIAEETFIGERSVAKQLGELAKKGYVISHKRGKQSYYEVAEPLMRLVLDVKNSQGKPLKLVTSLLRAWFSDAELGTVPEKESKLLSSYKKAALSIDKEILVVINIIIAEQVYAGIATNDYKQVITASSEIINAPQTDGIPLWQRVNALTFRGAAYFLTGETEKAFQELIAVIDMQDLSVKQRAQALFFRACVYIAKSEIELALQDWAAVKNLQGVSKELVTLISFVLPIVYFSVLQIDKAQLALEEAFAKDGKNCQHLPLNTSNILRSITQLGSSFWQKQIIWILALYSKYKALDFLGVALILSDTSFIDDDSLTSSFKKWQNLWQKYAEKYQEMLVPLQVLQASLLAIEQKNDKPLMTLPKEIRELVLPLLEKALI